MLRDEQFTEDETFLDAAFSWHVIEFRHLILHFFDFLLELDLLLLETLQFLLEPLELGLLDLSLVDHHLFFHSCYLLIGDR